MIESILISGASIAGPALAWWLSHYGFRPTLVEKAPGPRPGGHAIDVRGAALDVVRTMGVEDQIRRNRTQMKGVSKLNADGVEIWRSEEMTISGGSFDNPAIEILRDNLSNILVSALPDSAKIMCGDSIRTVREEGNGLIVSFEKAPGSKFDLVVGADGLTSNIRRLVFGPDGAFVRPFDVVLAPYTTPNVLGLEDWQLTYDAGRNSCMIYTAPGNRALRVCFGFAAKMEDLPVDRAGQIALVKNNCGYMKWEVPRLLETMEQAADFYLAAIAQVKMDRWTKGRVALVGDAAYCPSPYTGQGTSLALVGAHALAYELSQSPEDHVAAFDRYENRMRPFVEINQAIADLSRDPRFMKDPDYYVTVIEPAMARAEYAIELPALCP